MKQTPAEVPKLTPFSNALHLYPTIDAVVKHNVAKLQENGHPVATIKAVHSGPNADKISPEDARGLESIICLGCEACIMLTANLWDSSMVLWEQWLPSATDTMKLHLIFP